jgi:molecular chaperone DnaK
MAAQNRSLGRFELVGIPPAPRGVPQIEVAFDIDANGIVHVSAKDLGTGKEQKIRIESSSGLSEQEIEKMVREAEAHAEEDKAAKEKVEAVNEADSLIYSTEKALNEMGDKVSEAEKNGIQQAISSLREAMEKGDASEIRSRIDNLKQASHKLAENVYQQQAGSAQAGNAGGAGNGQSGNTSGTDSHDDDVENVDYEVVNEE